jgi:hypothetical protein
MSLTDEEKQSVIAYRLDKANKTLSDAKKVIESDVKPMLEPAEQLINTVSSLIRQEYQLSE